jgi:N-acetylmuramic acid 6-phosphate (MurNAc-6-P) etherase
MDAAKLMRNALITTTIAIKFQPVYKNFSILLADVRKHKLNEEALALIMDAKLYKKCTLARPKAKG